MLSAFCGRGKDRTQYLSACSPTLYPLCYPARLFTMMKVRLYAVTMCLFDNNGLKWKGQGAPKDTKRTAQRDITRENHANSVGLNLLL
jgi:hypothetical protein